MERVYGQIAESSTVNEAIYEYFRYIAEKDRRKFVTKFRKQPHDENQVMHTFRELILGAYLASSSLKIEYDRKIDGKTPDWVILNDESSPGGIVELVNFHADQGTEKDIERQLKDPEPEFTIQLPSGPIPVAFSFKKLDNLRLYQRIKEKSDKYEHLAKKDDIPYVVAVFGDIKAGVQAEDIRQCLFEDYGGGLFRECPTLSGVLFFKESAGKYVFEFTRNPDGVNDIEIPCGVF